MISIWFGGCTAPCVRKFYCWWAKDAKFQGLYSLNVYDFWVLQGGSLLASYLDNFAFDNLKMLNLFFQFLKVGIYKYDFGVSMSLPKKIYI